MSRRSLDNYPTPSRLTDALLREVPIYGSVLEPCAGEGLMARALQSLDRPIVRQVYCNDIDPLYGYAEAQDAADPKTGLWRLKMDWVVTNPPYAQAMPILASAYRCAKVGVAFLLRLSFLEPTNGRREWLQAHQGELSHLLIFGSPRPSFTDDGRTDSATVAWMVWQHGWDENTVVRFVAGWDGRG